MSIQLTQLEDDHTKLELQSSAALLSIQSELAAVKMQLQQCQDAGVAMSQSLAALQEQTRQSNALLAAAESRVQSMMLQVTQLEEQKHQAMQNLEAAQLPVFSINRLNVMGFYASDHGARDGSSLISWVRALLRERGLPDDGEVVLQTFPRVLGFAFNPVSFWFCYDCLDHLVAVLAEVNNTFGGHHNYLLHNPDGSPLIDGQEFCSDKVFHVSPFCLVRGVYHFRFYLDGAVQKASIEYDDSDGKSLILTSISGRKRSWSNWDLIKVFLLMPFLTLGIVWRIHWQALRLWCKKVPFYGASPPPT